MSTLTRALRSAAPTPTFVSRRLLAVLLLAAALCAAAAWFAAPVISTPGARRTPAGPLGALSQVTPARDVFEGTVEERWPAGPYTYLGLRTQDGGALRWAVTMGRAYPVGARVRIRAMGHSRDFYSARLQRSFSELVFGTATRL